MTNIQETLLTVSMGIVLCFCITLLLSNIQNMIHDYRREQREQEQAKREVEKNNRELEYHKERMKNFK